MPVPWRAPCLWRPLPASIAGRAGARPDHPIIGNLIDWPKATAGHAHAMISDNRNGLSWLSVCGCDGSRRAFLLKAFAKNCAIVSRGSSPCRLLIDRLHDTYCLGMLAAFTS